MGYRCLFISKGLLFPVLLFINTTAIAAQNILPVLNQSESQKARQTQLAPEGATVMAPKTDIRAGTLIFPDETPCIVVNHIIIDERDTLPHWLPLKKLTAQATGHCLGIKGIEILTTALQNQIIAYGFITTRLSVPDQDMQQGILHIKIEPGRVGKIRLDETGDRYIQLANNIPLSSGELLSLRSLEQGLENLQRAPGSSANIQLVPGDTEGTSDIIIKREQIKYWRLAAWMDDAGSRYTGRYQGGGTLYLDNVTTFNDLMYVSAGGGLQNTRDKNSKYSSLYYSIPYGWWSIDVYASEDKYTQHIVDGDNTYQYKGDEKNLSINFARTLFRNGYQKLLASWQLQKRDYRYFLNDTEIMVQRHKMSTWRAMLEHIAYPGNVIINSRLSLQKNNNWIGATPSVEEQTGTADAGSRLINLGVEAHVPFSLFGHSLSWHPQYHQQITPDKLNQPDKLSLGNRWTVRGFDGDSTLQADTGWYLRNDINMDIPQWNQQLYVGIDVGKVTGNGSEVYSSRTLSGGVMGLRGSLGRTNYDFFVGAPFKHPEELNANPFVMGMTLHWDY
ncbi:ShlB/FhaC/HecB family hemolysin secretion/activation protein [Atlantibacter subterraneus]|uniref:ShlB/FhaC/HecB family hemolysin secretion/activation protein n=1 Tax=Atlantibacter subterraneus TaxID=255519 RepID=UPI002FDEF032